MAGIPISLRSHAREPVRSVAARSPKSDVALADQRRPNLTDRRVRDIVDSINGFKIKRIHVASRDAMAIESAPKKASAALFGGQSKYDFAF